MRTRTKALIAVGAAALIGSLAVTGVGYASRAGFGPGGFMGHGGPHGGMAMNMLRSFDSNKDGKLTQAEIDQERTKRFSTYDADGDSRLAVSEFGALWQEVTQPMMVRAFQYLDPDGDGSISADEFDEPFANVVGRFDRNGDGALSPEDRPRHHGRHWDDDRHED